MVGGVACRGRGLWRGCLWRAGLGKGMQEQQVDAYQRKTDSSHVIGNFGGLVTAAAAAGLATVSAGRAFAIGLKIQFVLFDLSVREGHLRIVEAILLVLLYRGTGADHHDRQQTGDE